MMRLFDLHAASCAGDTLITIGLAGTIFFDVPLGEARGQVALYLLVTMVPFALLAPVVGPLLDRFRHGRRYALAATFLGRAFLAWVIADNLDSTSRSTRPRSACWPCPGRTAWPAAAAVPRLLPAGPRAVPGGRPGERLRHRRRRDRGADRASPPSRSARSGRCGSPR